MGLGVWGPLPAAPWWAQERPEVGIGNVPTPWPQVTHRVVGLWCLQLCSCGLAALPAELHCASGRLFCSSEVSGSLLSRLAYVCTYMLCPTRAVLGTCRLWGALPQHSVCSSL